ncbi:hypothetical protein [Thalassobacillus hwangdonensis]|uniref:Cbb3-type cytochrome c oxidase subunit I n=1 Tax=Thalassobacillus hwangdonensis TaxID=546108 RepID=A0ABW3L2N7_9BACI
MEQYSRTLLRFSGVFALIGAFIGAHMAGSGSYALRPIHAHILVVGWLSLFAWSVYYKVFNVTALKLAKVQVWTGIIGTTGLTFGMWLHFLDLFSLPDAVTLTFYIGGGTILLISFVLFLVSTFFLSSESE